MVNQQTLEGSWTEIKGKVREKWGQLTEDDFLQARGNIDQLAGIIQRKTGEGRDAIESYLRDLSSHSASMLSAASDKAREYGHQAAAGMERAGRQAAEQIRAGYTEAQRLVRDQPSMSLGVCFAAGVLTGIFLAVALRGR